MTGVHVFVALIGGVAGTRAVSTLLPRAASPRVASLVAGAIGGVIAAMLVATVVAAERAVPLPATALSGGIDLASILGSAAAGALGGIVLSIVAGMLIRALRAR
jgi:hypothetical protein